MSDSTTLLQTHVRHGDRWWFVSTADRESSAVHAYGHEYAETIVWEWDADKRERGRIVLTDGAGKGSIRKHKEIVERLHKTGLAEEPNHDDC